MVGPARIYTSHAWTSRHNLRRLHACSTKGNKHTHGTNQPPGRFGEERDYAGHDWQHCVSFPVAVDGRVKGYGPLQQLEYGRELPLLDCKQASKQQQHKMVLRMDGCAQSLEWRVCWNLTAEASAACLPLTGPKVSSKLGSRLRKRTMTGSSSSS